MTVVVCLYLGILLPAQPQRAIMAAAALTSAQRAVCPASHDLSVLLCSVPSGQMPLPLPSINSCLCANNRSARLIVDVSQHKKSSKQRRSSPSSADAEKALAVARLRAERLEREAAERHRSLVATGQM